MGRVLTEVKLENLKDLWEVEKGLRKEADVRRVVVLDALVDTGASTLSLPSSLIKQLGLQHVSKRRIRTAIGSAEVSLFDSVKFTIQGRDAKLDVMEVPDDVPVLVGQLPLEMLDFVVDPSSRRLIGNPAHNGEWIMELY
jgi:predicted aspartyl protease